MYSAFLVGPIFISYMEFQMSQESNSSPQLTNATPDSPLMRIQDLRALVAQSRHLDLEQLISLHPSLRVITTALQFSISQAKSQRLGAERTSE